MLEELLNDIHRGAVMGLSRCNQIVDVGANIGLASLFFLDRYPEAKLLAIEPHPESADLLRRNLRRWIRKGRCEILEAAAWTADEPLELAAPDTADHFSAFRVRQAISSTRALVVRGVSMDAIVAMTAPDRIDLMKIDIEGAEREIFAGDLTWLDAVDRIAIEFHDDARASTRFDELAKRNGFEIVGESDNLVVAQRQAPTRHPAGS